MSGVQLPDEQARELYLRLLERGGLWPVAEVGPAEAPVFERLRAAGLATVIAPDLREVWLAVDPQLAGQQLSAGLRAAGVALLAKADEAVPEYTELVEAFDRLPDRLAGRRVIRNVAELEPIQRRVEQLIRTCRREVVAAQPGGSRPAEVLPTMYANARDLAARGLVLRTLYQPAVRADPGTAAYAAYATGLGMRIRVLDEDFKRVMIFDRRVAVIPGREDNMSATFVEEPALVDVLVAMFERDWERAERVRWESPVEPGDAPLIALLAQGLTQRTIGSRLGLSERTVAARIAALRERYDAQTLFQLGWQARAGAVPPQ
ncbi:LuxR family transcriptional regulator [Streptomyces tateyamensis]|uniref:LuxR family transcriptional regulator n=1 Tax=Streptomyces tateyamensis TaxID=565073 RepID=A0A2V4NJ80_9ACTN|nr:LuxR family transcriptional regulator [Streptomyces tateyamensis]PYC68715.1 LuxR family transcriptional regulator [Streptomyces tateyamensis]